jgi:hypothetical protein
VFYDNASYDYWGGVKGRIRIPDNASPTIDFDYTKDMLTHHLRADFDDGQWLEVGVYIGSFGDCPDISNLGPVYGYGACVEHFDGEDLNYEYLGAIDADDQNRFQVSHYTNGTWRIYINGGLETSVYIGEETGFMLAGTEVGDYDCLYFDDCDDAPDVPQAGMGHPSNSTYKLRLLRESNRTWEDWDSSLTDGSTGRVDEQCGFGSTTAEVQQYDKYASTAHYYLLLRSFDEPDEC